MNIVILELNEVPPKILNEYYGTSINGKYSSDFNVTITRDKGRIDPWITWSTVHRGVINTKHKLNDINQDCSLADNLYPTIFDECIKKGLSVGLVNTMHSGRYAEKERKDFTFLIPEGFSPSSFCIPKSLEPFQRFNLKMTSLSARVVSKQIPKNINLFEVLFSYLKNVKKFRAIKKVFKQLILEIFNPLLKVRRRTIQSDLLFDLFVTLLEKKRPNISFFYTNHVASSMHKFWEATYPYEYEKQISSSEWIHNYKNEIPYTMKTTKEYINYFRNFVDKNDNFQLWIMSSMGQTHLDGYEPEHYFWDIVDMNAYVSSCIKRDVRVKVLQQMIPIYSFEANKKLIDEFVSFIKISENIKLRSKTNSTVAFSINNQKGFLLTNNHKFMPNGILKKEIEEKSSCSAIHSPEGILLRYGPNLKEIDKSYFNESNFVYTDKIKELILDATKN